MDFRPRRELARSPIIGDHAHPQPGGRYERGRRRRSKYPPKDRLARLGLTLPPVPSAVGDYEPWVEVNGNIYTSGQLPWIDGDLKFIGKMGRELTTEDGYQAFRLSGLNAGAKLKSAVGELSRIKRIVRPEGTAHCTSDFIEQPQALNGASHLFNEVFAEKGRHSRMIYSDPAMCLNCATLLVVWAQIKN